jgi:hypothetical protein
MDEIAGFLEIDRAIRYQLVKQEPSRVLGGSSSNFKWLSQPKNKPQGTNLANH